MMGKTDRKHPGKKHSFPIGKVALLCAVLAFCAFGFTQMGDTADCGGEASVSYAPKTMRSASARGAWTTEPITPDGNTYVVTTPGQLAWVAEQVNATASGGGDSFAGKTVSLGADLDLGANEWVPIAIADDYPFEGTFIGNNHTISNMKITAEIQVATSFNVIGLFGAVGGGSVSGVHLRSVNINYPATGAVSSIGALVGRANDASIVDCTVQGSVVTTLPDVGLGGIVGRFIAGATPKTFANCHVLEGSVVSGTTMTGGIAGYNSGGAIIGCTFTGAKVSGGGTFGVAPSQYGPSVGGIVGTSAGGSVEGCVASADIAKTSGMRGVVGGIMGEFYTAGGSITNCAAYGTVSGSSCGVGGILGYSGRDSVIESCTNEAAVSNIFTGDTVDNTFSTAYASGGGDNFANIGTGGVVGLIENKGAGGTVSISSVANSGAVKMTGAIGGTAATQHTYRVGAGGVVGTLIDGTMGTGSISAVIETSMNEGVVAADPALGSMTLQGGFYVAAGGIAGFYDAEDPVTNGSAKLFSSYNNMGSVSARPSGKETATLLMVYAGGLIGWGTEQTSNLDEYLNLSNSYNTGDVTASGSNAKSYAGGLLGYYEGPSSGQTTTLQTSYSFANTLTGGYKGGYVGGTFLGLPTLSNNVYRDDANAINDIGNTSTTSGRSSTSSMQNGTAFNGNPVDWSSNSAWNLPINSLPTLNYTNPPTGLVASPGVLTITAGQSGTMECALMPNEKVRAAVTATYSAAVVASSDVQYFSSITPTANGVTFTSNGTPGIVKVRISANDGTNTHTRDIFVQITEPLGEGMVEEFYVRNIPVVPVESTTRDIYITWKAVGDADGTARSPDALPSPMPEVTWSVTSPTGGGNWTVTVDADAANPFRARLTIGSPAAASPAVQEYKVSVHMKQEGGIDETYTRSFFAGKFSTNVHLSPEAQEEIDAANAILARTGVMIMPGNHQPQIPSHILAMISEWLDNGLVEYTTSAARSARGVSEDLYVLTSLDVIDEMRVESPDESSIPDCFVCTDKQSANILLDLDKLSDPDAVGKIVLLPMTYSVKLESDDLRDFYDDGAGAGSVAILADPVGNLDRIFDVLVLHKRIKEGAMLNWYTRLVRGVATPKDAYDFGMLQIDKDEQEGSLTIRLGYNVLNYHGESFTVRGNLVEGDAASDLVGYIVLPDGEQNKWLIDPLWTNRWTTSGGGGGGGGGGCATGAPFACLMLALAGIAANRRRR